MPGELLMPLLSGEQPALRRLDGRQHAYVQPLTTNAVMNATMAPVLEAHRTGDFTGHRELPSMLWRPTNQAVF